MKQTVNDEALGEITYEESFWTGRKTVSVNGVALEKVSKKLFRTADGKAVTVNGNFFTGACLNVDGRSIRVTPAVKWYEIALCLLPFILIMVWGNVVALVKIIPIMGGAIGGAIGGLFCICSLYAMKSVGSVWLKILIAIVMTLVAFLICFLIAYIYLHV